MKRLLLTLLTILVVSCNQNIDIDPDTGFEVFTIPTGGHSSIVRNEAFTGTGINVTVLFDESAEYTLDVTSDQADINKLIGFSDCHQDHQSESARLGWRWFDDELQILAYTYREGQLSFELMGAVSMNQEIDLQIRIVGDTYQYSGTGLTSVTMDRTPNCETGDNYWLWPYFGGDQPAPHEVTIKLKREIIE
ncbi:hypothetical protein [Roseivirga sp.]|uniref:hypothetical protein n=1 Tax=Roseivirga sp. TaxID=1964215 RepID=UPI003B51A7A7